MKITQISQIKEKSKFQPEYKNVHIPGVYGYTMVPQPLAPEIEAEKQEQISQMEEAIAEQLDIPTKPDGHLDLNPWGSTRGKYDAKEFSRIVMQGVQEGKWDEYLAKDFLSKTERAWDAVIR